MKAIITVQMDNAAFSEPVNGTELARILRELADGIEQTALENGDGGGLFDSNGNRVCKWEVSE